MEAALWAAAYARVGAIGSFTDALLFSVATITTRGTSAVALPDRWQMMAALEAVNGMSLFGISTAFVFTMLLQIYWVILSRRH